MGGETGKDPVLILYCAAVPIWPYAASYSHMPLESVEIPVTGMTCNNCARSIERKLKSAAGVQSASVDLVGAKAKVEYDPAETERDELITAIQSLGYQVPGASQTS
jgi:copper chaperone CopZ